MIIKNNVELTSTSSNKTEIQNNEIVQQSGRSYRLLTNKELPSSHSKTNLTVLEKISGLVGKTLHSTYTALVQAKEMLQRNTQAIDKYTEKQSNFAKIGDFFTKIMVYEGKKPPEANKVDEILNNLLLYEQHKENLSPQEKKEIRERIQERFDEKIEETIKKKESKEKNISTLAKKVEDIEIKAQEKTMHAEKMLPRIDHLAEIGDTESKIQSLFITSLLKIELAQNEQANNLIKEKQLILDTIENQKSEIEKLGKKLEKLEKKASDFKESGILAINLKNSTKEVVLNFT